MKVSFVSSQAISQAMRYQMLRMQADLVTANKEMVELRFADVGVALGARTGMSVSMHREIDRLKGLSDSNELAAARLKSTQVGLQDLSKAADKLFAAYTTASSDATDPKIARKEAEAVLATMTSVLNANLNGEHLFAGINTDVTPIADFLDPASPNRVALEDAFATYPFADPNNITDVEMDAFLTSVEDQFLGADWNTHWSTATDQQITSRITLTETAQTSVSANIDGVRKLAMAAATVAVVFDETLSDKARAVVLERTIGLIGESILDLANQQGFTGITEQRIEQANERMSMQVDLLNNSLIDLEGVDPFEATTRVEGLRAQIELSYALTARMQQMSLLKYLS